MAGAGTAAAGARAEAGGARDGVGTGVAATEPPPKLPQSSLPAPAEGVLSSATAAGARVGGDGSGAPDIIASKAPHLLSSPLISGASSFSTTSAVSTFAATVGGAAIEGTASLLASPKLPQSSPSPALAEAGTSAVVASASPKLPQSSHSPLLPAAEGCSAT